MPPPTVLDFEGATLGALDRAFYPGVTIDTPGFCAASRRPPSDCGSVVAPGHDSSQALAVGFNSELDLRFAAPQAEVSLYVATPGPPRAAAT